MNRAGRLVHRATAYAHQINASEANFYAVAHEWVDKHQARYGWLVPRSIYKEAHDMLSLLRQIWEKVLKEAK